MRGTLAGIQLARTPETRTENQGVRGVASQDGQTEAKRGAASIRAEHNREGQGEHAREGESTEKQSV